MSKDIAPKKDELTELKVHAVKVFYRMLILVALLVGIGLGTIGGWFIHTSAMGDAAQSVASLKG